MFAHFTRMAFQAFLRFRVHSLIGLVSLVLGFACLLSAKLLGIYLTSFDSDFPGSERTYSVLQQVESESMSVPDMPIVGRPVAEHLRAAFPELEHVVRSSWPQRLDVTADASTQGVRGRFVSDGFFELFPMPMLRGIPTATALPPDSVVISETAARRRFGTVDVIGKRLRLWHRFDVTIAGVWRTPDSPNHIDSALPLLRADLVGPIELYDRWDDQNNSATYEDPTVDQWNDTSYLAYIQFPPGPVDTAEFQERLDHFSETRVPSNHDYRRSYTIQPISQIALSAVRALFQGVDVIRLIVSAGYLVLMIAGLNYSNLFIAQLALRSQEVGMQKILGARRRLLVLQYAYESALFVLMALAITVLVFYPTLNALGSRGLTGVSAGLLLDPSLWVDVVVAVVVIVAIGGAYPVLRTLRVSLVTLLRPRGSSGYSGRLRTTMVAAQFMISCTLIIVSLMMIGQNRAMQSRLDAGFADPKVVITVPLDTLTVDPDVLANELTRHPAVLSATQIGRLPWTLGMTNVNLSSSPERSAPTASMILNRVSYGFSETLGIPILHGRSFDRGRAGDVAPTLVEMLSSSRPSAIIIDERTAADLGWENAREAVGQRVYEHLIPPQVKQPTAVEYVVAGIAGPPPFQIVNYDSFGMSGHGYLLSPPLARFLTLRISRRDVAAGLAHLDAVWQRLLPGTALKRQFTDELFHDSYGVFLHLSNAVIGLSLFGFFIAAIGLLGNATFITNIRQREVGIRKVMGATTSRLVAMLLLDFAKPVIIANLIAWPLAYVLAKAYVSLFSVQAPVTLVPFLISLVISVMIACVAVVSQSYRSARTRPATILRYE